MNVNALEQYLGESRLIVMNRLLDRIRRYVEIESPSRNETAINEVATVIASDLRKLDGNVEIVPAPGFGSHIVATFGANDTSPVMILAHMDTVHPVGTIESQPFRVGNGRAEGPGIYDMKSSIAVAVEAIRLAKRNTNRQIRFLVTCDEEVGSESGRVEMHRMAPGVKAALVIEPCLGAGAVKTARKGVATYRVDVFGKAAHAGVEPGQGVDAIGELADIIVQVHALANHSVGTTINVGTIRGGTATNVIPAHAVAEIDVRYRTMSEAERIDAAMHAIKPRRTGATIDVKQTESRPPLERTPSVVGLYEKARAVAAPFGVVLEEGSTGGGSDGCFTAAMGIPTLDGLGPCGGGAHAVDEHIIIEDLPFRAAFLARLLEDV